MKVILFLVCLLLFVPVYSQNMETPESLHYKILVLGMKIGDMKAEKYSGKADTTHYEVNSQVKFWFFGNVELKFSTISKFTKGKIVKTKSESKTNRGDYLSRITWKDSEYQVKAETYKYENSASLKGPLSWCSNKMFFHEPKAGEIFLSEVYGTSQPIKQLEPGVYEVTVEGNRNRYYYKSGILEKIVLENPIKNYQVKLVR
uniref:DUF6134 family protein n=1 Tax=Algoriphagus sp. TaxID=1872435 RepID=UPI00258607C6|nr:DUF6134 family protein [Algoriphagus sp.]